uniref:WSC domain-containing protein n=1 Tax=Macrostomum lignano TaxID=282301 RepID=A0A1I8FQQ2_9PLAT
KLQFGECYQSSTSSGGACERAFDGRINQHYAAGSCTHTKAEKGFWQAYIRGSGFARVRFVLIYNRLDCCSDRLNSFSIFLDGQECESYSSRKSFSVKIFRCNKVGQMLVIKNRIKTPLTLCEVQIFGNYIPRNPYGVEPSTTTITNSIATIPALTPKMRRAGGRREPSRCLTFGRFESPTGLTVAQTAKQHFVIMVDGHECASYKSNSFFSIRAFKCDRIGQVVTVRNRKTSPLTLCEVQVYGEEVKLPTPKIWLVASDSQERSLVKQVRIYNRLDCCSERLNDFSITVDGQECASFKSSGFFSVKTFQCNKVGQKLRINNRKRSPLTLCEVQVFGEKKKSAIKAGHFVGCFFESNHWPDFDSLASSSDDMTREKCNCLCLKRGTSVFALREGNQCRCGDNYGSNGEAERSDCRLPCAGDSDQMCGGRMVNAVFKVDKNHC